MEERFYLKYALAYIRGELKRSGIESPLVKKPIDELSAEDAEGLIGIAQERKIKLYHFKRSDRTLPRVNKVIGFLKGIGFDGIVDVGSGRGVFLLPFLEEFPWIPVTSVEIFDKRVRLLENLRSGGIDRLSVCARDICDSGLPEKSCDVVTMLEVLEHIQRYRDAIREAVRIARKYIIITVPSKEDDNPEHIHLLTKDKLKEAFLECGIDRLHFEGVPGHLFMIASLQEKK